MTESPLIAATIGVPVAALLLASAFQSVRKVAHDASLSIVIVALCVWLIVVAPGQMTVVDLLSTSWLQVAGVPPVDIRWQLSVQSASALLVIIGLLALGISSRLGRSRPVESRSTPSDWLLRQLLLTCGAFSADLVAILMSWLVTDAVIDWQRAKACQRGEGSDCKPAASALTPLRLTSMLLLVAIAVLSARYRTTDVAALLEAVRSDERIDASAVRGGLAICMAAAIAFRCGQFPAVLWVKRLTAGSSPIGIGGLLPILLPAVVLAVRLSPLWRMAPEAGSLFASQCTLTTVTMGMTACSTRRFSEVPTIVCVMLCGQALICCGSPFSDAAFPVGLGLLAIVVSLLLRPLLAPRCSSVLHIAREWWFAEEFARFAIVGPLRVVAILVEFIDRRLLGGGREDAWTQPGTRFANLMDSVRDAEPKYCGIAIVWAVIGLLAVLAI